MTEEQKQYIEQNIDLINDSEWKKFFKEAPIGVGLLLYEAGVNFLKDVSEIDSSMFHYSDLTELVIPNNIRSIRRSAFDGCSSLTSIEIPDSVTSIDNRAFYDCTSVTSVTIPDSVTSIGEYAFAYCDSLMSVTIGDSVTYIGDCAVFNCISLTKAVVNNPNATFGRDVFSNVSPRFKLHGYRGSTAEDYANRNKHKFVAID